MNIKVTFSDGSVIRTKINLDLKAVQEYYLNNLFEINECAGMVRGVKVKEIGE